MLYLQESFLAVETLQSCFFVTAAWISPWARRAEISSPTFTLRSP